MIYNHNLMCIFSWPQLSIILCMYIYYYEVLIYYQSTIYIYYLGLDHQIIPIIFFPSQLSE